jgi:hypothetical protein
LSELASKRTDIEWKESSPQGEMNPNYGGGKYIDDRGYVRVLVPDHPKNIKGYIYEHRYIMETYLGRYLQTWESVHHINEVKEDNRIENLFLCSTKEHSAIHREGKRPSEKHRETLRKNMTERNNTVKRNMKKKPLRPLKQSRMD